MGLIALFAAPLLLAQTPQFDVVTITGELPELPPFTRRETSVLLCLGRGYSDKDIANSLSLTHTTARSYVADLMQKTGRNRHELGIFGYVEFQGDSGLNLQPCGLQVA